MEDRRTKLVTDWTKTNTVLIDSARETQACNRTLRFDEPFIRREQNVETAKRSTVPAGGPPARHPDVCRFVIDFQVRPKATLAKSGFAHIGFRQAVL